MTDSLVFVGAFDAAPGDEDAGAGGAAATAFDFVPSSAAVWLAAAGELVAPGVGWGSVVAVVVSFVAGRAGAGDDVWLCARVLANNPMARATDPSKPMARTTSKAKTTPFGFDVRPLPSGVRGSATAAGRGRSTGRASGSGPAGSTRATGCGVLPLPPCGRLGDLATCKVVCLLQMGQAMTAPVFTTSNSRCVEQCWQLHLARILVTFSLLLADHSTYAGQQEAWKATGRRPLRTGGAMVASE